MKDQLPEEICYRKDKIGFLSPFHQWLANGFGELMLEHSRSASFLESDIWKGQAISNAIETHYRNQKWERLFGYWPFIQADILMNTFREKRAEFSG